MEERYPVYFEATYKNTIAGYTCGSFNKYRKRLTDLLRIYPDLELVYREWSDGTIEDGLIEKEDWNIG
jgi:hypothetical protein